MREGDAVRLTYRMRVVWPDQTAWLTVLERDLGGSGLAALAPVDDDGWVVGVEEDGSRTRVGGREGHPEDGLRLVGGSHLAPGARYELRQHDLTVGTVEAEVTGSVGDREVRVDYTERARHRGGAELVVHGLDRAVGVTARSRLENLAGDLRLSTTGAEVMRAEVRLPWAAAEARATLGPADGPADGPAGERDLVVVVTVHGRRAYRALLSPVLGAVGMALRRWGSDPTADVPAWLASVAAGQEPPARVADPVAAYETRRAAEVDQAWVEVLPALLELDAQFRLRPWWQRRRRVWRREAEAYVDSFPPVRRSLLGDLTPAEQWSQDRRIAAGAIVRLTRSSHSPGRAAAMRRVDASARSDREARLAVSLRAAAAATPEVVRRSWDEQLDLSWLATPMTTLRHLRSTSPTAPAPVTAGRADR